MKTKHIQDMSQVEILETFEPDRNKAPNAARALTLELNKRRQIESPGIAKITSDQGEYGYLALDIPPLDYAVLIERNPDLNSKDAEINNKAWMRFIRSPESLPYRFSGGNLA